MAVDPEISRAYLRKELALLNELAVTHGWEVAPDLDRLLVVTKMRAHTGDLFVIEARCDGYKEIPPFLEFIDPESGERGTRHAYPKTTDSLFHDAGPCMCAPFSRKAYTSVAGTGPHSDWRLGDWQTSTTNNIHWTNFSTLPDMFGLIHTRISRPDLYRGRMG